MQNNLVAYSRILSRRNSNRVYGGALNSWDPSAVYRKRKPRCSSLIFGKEDGPSLGVIQPTSPHERSPYAPKFEGPSQEETLRQERCARRDASELTKSVQHSSRLRMFGVFLRHPQKKTKGKRIGCRFWTINAHDEQERPELGRTGNCSTVQKPYNGRNIQWRSANERRSNSVRQRHGFYSSRFTLEHTPPVLSLGKLCEDHGYSCE